MFEEEGCGMGKVVVELGVGKSPKVKEESVEEVVAVKT